MEEAAFGGGAGERGGALVGGRGIFAMPEAVEQIGAHRVEYMVVVEAVEGVHLRALAMASQSCRRRS